MFTWCQSIFSPNFIPVENEDNPGRKTQEALLANYTSLWLNKQLASGPGTLARRRRSKRLQGTQEQETGPGWEEEGRMV